MTITLALAKARPGAAPQDAVQRMENAIAFFAGGAGTRSDDEALVREFREAELTFAAADRLKLFEACDARFAAGLARAQDLLRRSVSTRGGVVLRP